MHEGRGEMSYSLGHLVSGTGKISSAFLMVKSLRRWSII